MILLGSDMQHGMGYLQRFFNPHNIDVGHVDRIGICIQMPTC